MISNKAFEKIRFHQFIDQEEIDQLENYEYLGLIWVGEGCYGFSDCIQLETEPQTTRCIHLDLREMPSEITRAILDFINLPLRGGMTKQEMDALLGKPQKVIEFMPGRNKYYYRPFAEDNYEVGGTILCDVGLFFITIISDPEDIYWRRQESERKSEI